VRAPVGLAVSVARGSSAQLHAERFHPLRHRASYESL
jgi:hypothetical protein